ncbi:uncharacterized protein V6R79_001067 [Siganus canaliculatus]
MDPPKEEMCEKFIPLVRDMWVRMGQEQGLVSNASPTDEMCRALILEILDKVYQDISALNQHVAEWEREERSGSVPRCDGRKQRTDCHTQMKIDEYLERFFDAWREQEAPSASSWTRVPSTDKKRRKHRHKKKAANVQQPHVGGSEVRDPNQPLVCDEAAETAICMMSEETSSAELPSAAAEETAGEDSESGGSTSSSRASGKAEKKRRKPWRKLWKWTQLKSSRTSKNKKSPWKKFWKWANKRQSDKSQGSGSEPSPAPEEHVGSDACVETVSRSSVEVRPSILSPLPVKMVSSSPAFEDFDETVLDLFEPQSYDLEAEQHLDSSSRRSRRSRRSRSEVLSTIEPSPAPITVPQTSISESKHSPELQQSEDREEAVDSPRSTSSEESSDGEAPPSAEGRKSDKKRKSTWKKLWKWMQRPQDKSEAHGCETVSRSSEELSSVPVEMVSDGPVFEDFDETALDLFEPQSYDLEAEQQLDSSSRRSRRSRRSRSEVLSTTEPPPAPITTGSPVSETSLSISESKQSPELQQAEDREEAVDSPRSISSEESSDGEAPPSAEGRKSVKKRKSTWKKLWKWMQRPQDKSEARKLSPAPEEHVESEDGCERVSRSSDEVGPTELSSVPVEMVSDGPVFEDFDETVLDLFQPQSYDLEAEQQLDSSSRRSRRSRRSRSEVLSTMEPLPAPVTTGSPVSETSLSTSEFHSCAVETEHVSDISEFKHSPELQQSEDREEAVDSGSSESEQAVNPCCVPSAEGRKSDKQRKSQWKKLWKWMQRPQDKSEARKLSPAPEEQSEDGCDTVSRSSEELSSVPVEMVSDGPVFEDFDETVLDLFEPQSYDLEAEQQLDSSSRRSRRSSRSSRRSRSEVLSTMEPLPTPVTAPETSLSTSESHSCAVETEHVSDISELKHSPELQQSEDREEAVDSPRRTSSEGSSESEAPPSAEGSTGVKESTWKKFEKWAHLKRSRRRKNKKSPWKKFWKWAKRRPDKSQGSGSELSPAPEEHVGSDERADTVSRSSEELSPVPVEMVSDGPVFEDFDETVLDLFQPQSYDLESEQQLDSSSRRSRSEVLSTTEPPPAPVTTGSPAPETSLSISESQSCAVETEHVDGTAVSDIFESKHSPELQQSEDREEAVDSPRSTSSEGSSARQARSSAEGRKSVKKRRKPWRKLWKWTQLKSSRTSKNKKSPWKKFWKWANKRQSDKSQGSGSEPSPAPEEHVGSEDGCDTVSRSSVELSSVPVEMVSDGPAFEDFDETALDLFEPQSYDLETEQQLDSSSRRSRRSRRSRSEVLSTMEPPPAPVTAPETSLSISESQSCAVETEHVSDSSELKQSPELQQSEDREEAVDSGSSESEQAVNPCCVPSAEGRKSDKKRKSQWKKLWKWIQRPQDKSEAHGCETVSRSSEELSPGPVEMFSDGPAFEDFDETALDLFEPQSYDLEAEQQLDSSSRRSRRSRSEVLSTMEPPPAPITVPETSLSISESQSCHLETEHVSDISELKHSPELQQSEDREEAVDSGSSESEQAVNPCCVPSAEGRKSVKQRKSQWKKLWKWIQRPQDKSEARKLSPAPEEQSDDGCERVSRCSEELSSVPVEMVSDGPVFEDFDETALDLFEPQSYDLEAEQQLDSSSRRSRRSRRSSRRSRSEVLSTMEPPPAPVTAPETSLSISESKHSPELQQSEDREEAVDSGSSEREQAVNPCCVPSAEGRKSAWKKLWKWIQRPQDKSEARKLSPWPEEHVGSEDGCETVSRSSDKVGPTELVSSSPAFEVFSETVMDVCEPQSCDLGTEHFMTETVDAERSGSKTHSCCDLELVEFELVYPSTTMAASLSPLPQDIQQEPLQVQLAALENIIKETLHRFFDRLDINRHLSNSAYKLQTTDEFVSTISEIMNAIVGTLNSNLIKVLRHITSTNELSGHVRKWVEDTEQQLKIRLKDTFSVDSNNAIGADQSDIVTSILKSAIYRRVTDEVTSVFSEVTEGIRSEPIQARAESPEITPEENLGAPFYKWVRDLFKTNTNRQDRPKKWQYWK